MNYNKSGKAITFLVAISLIWGIPLMIFSYCCINARWKIKIEGKIIERKPGHVHLHPNRELTDYKILQKDGTIIEYRAYGNDSQLSREMPVGGYLIKKKGDIIYTVDGKKYDDFPTINYVITGLIGALIFHFGIVFGILYIIKEFKPP